MVRDVQTLFPIRIPMRERSRTQRSQGPKAPRWHRVSDTSSPRRSNRTLRSTGFWYWKLALSKRSVVCTYCQLIPQVVARIQNGKQIVPSLLLEGVGSRSRVYKGRLREELPREILSSCKRGGTHPPPFSRRRESSWRRRMAS